MEDHGGSSSGDERRLLATLKSLGVDPEEEEEESSQPTWEEVKDWKKEEEEEEEYEETTIYISDSDLARLNKEAEHLMAKKDVLIHKRESGARWVYRLLTVAFLCAIWGGVAVGVEATDVGIIGFVFMGVFICIAIAAGVYSSNREKEIPGIDKRLDDIKYIYDLLDIRHPMIDDETGETLWPLQTITRRVR